MIRPITDRATFASFSSARRARCGPCSARYVPDQGSRAPAARVAFAVGRHAGNAVVRNRVRRRLRAALTELDRVGRLPSGAYLIAANADAAVMPYGELVTCMETITRSLHRATPGSRPAPSGSAPRGARVAP